MLNKQSEEEKNNEIPKGNRNKIFAMFLLADIFLNYDSGVIPASLLEITREVELGYKEQALLGSLVYLGLSFASLFTSPIFEKYGAAKVCTWILILNSCCCFIFSITSNKYIFFSMRFLMGATEAFVVVYGPVWVNNYSPKGSSTTWMGILHSCTVFGMISGYIIAGIVINFLSGIVNWRFAVQVQGIAQIPIALMFYFEREDFVNVSIETEPAQLISKEKKKQSSLHSEEVRNKNTENFSFDKRNVVQNKSNFNSGNISFQNPISKFSDDIDFANPGSSKHFLIQAKNILTNPLYLLVTFGLCSIYFIVTGIQFWMTAYLIEIIGGNPVTVVIIFSFTSVTAPLLGVLMGGAFADRYGGYKGSNTFKALQMCGAFGFISFVFAFPLGFVYSLIYIVVLLWTFLFFGAAIVPITTGIMISCIRREWQATSSSLSQLIFNFFGYFLSPFLTGFIMDCFDDTRVGFIWGIRVVFWWVFFCLIFLGGALLIEYRKIKSEGIDDSTEDEMQEDIAYFIRLEIRRRMALSSRQN